MENYEFVQEIGSGSFGSVRLMRNKQTKELVAVKYIERGRKITMNVARELVNHRQLRHPNVIGFKKVFLTPTHLAVVMEHASGGDMVYGLCRSGGRFSEDVAGYYFQQLIAGVGYCHAMQICHRDLKPNNALLVEGCRRRSPVLKICDFGFSKCCMLNSKEVSYVGTPGYVAPEIVMRQFYDRKQADVWSCGVFLYMMLFGDLPFVDRDDYRNIQEIFQRTVDVRYEVPVACVTEDCEELLSRMFVADPRKRITIKEIKQHSWFLKNLRSDLTEAVQAGYFYAVHDYSGLQSLKEILKLVTEAQMVPGQGKDKVQIKAVEDEGKTDRKRNVITSKQNLFRKSSI